MAQIFEGYNATVLAYGQTGSGKTHTMGTAFADDDADGVVPRAVADIMARRDALAADRDVAVVASMCEVYNEEVRDLLADGDELKPLAVLLRRGRSAETRRGAAAATP